MLLAEQDRLEVLESLKTIYNMPELSRFFGIVIAMFYNDHEPAHFHVFYNEYTARVNLSGEILSGHLPIRVTKLVEEWRELHEGELNKAWDQVQEHIPPEKISPLS